MTWKETWDRALALVPFKNKAQKVIEDNLAKAVSHAFNYKLEKDASVDIKNVVQLISLSPWSAVGSKPIVKVSVNDNGEKTLEIRFKALSKTKANLVEQNINNYLRNN